MSKTLFDSLSYVVFIRSEALYPFRWICCANQSKGWTFCINFLIVFNFKECDPLNLNDSLSTTYHLENPACWRPYELFFAIPQTKFINTYSIAAIVSTLIIIINTILLILFVVIHRKRDTRDPSKENLNFINSLFIILAKSDFEDIEEVEKVCFL